MKEPKKRKITVLNGLGTAGYIACVLQWFWMCIILLPSLVDSPMFQLLIPTSSTPAQPVTPSEPTAAGSVPLFVTILALCIGVAIVVGGFYIMFFKLPKSLAKTGEKVTHAPAEALTPLIVEHTHLPAKQRRAIPMLVIITVKLFLVFTPLCLLFFASELSLAMSFDLIMFIGIILFSWSFMAFAFQFALSQLLRVDYKTIR